MTKDQEANKPLSAGEEFRGSLSSGEEFRGSLSSGEEFRRRQKSKNIALGWAIGGLCLLFYVISIVRMGGL